MSNHAGSGGSVGLVGGAGAASAAGKPHNAPSRKAPSHIRQKPLLENGSTRSLQKSNGSVGSNKGERTVKKLRLTKALTIPDGTTVADACRRMATRRVDAALLTDTSGLLCGIITDKDVATRVIAERLNPNEASVSRVMTRNPVFVSSDTLAVDALQKMVQGKFRHLPVVENGEVIALLDITKCLYDAIARMERAAEKGNAIAAAVEDVERQWGNNLAAPSAFIETLRERMFRPTLGSLISEVPKVATISPADSVYAAAKKMSELRVNSVVITTAGKPQGILTSKDILMRVVAMGLPPELTPIEKVMTPNPECASPDDSIIEALHIMHDGKFLHLPIVDRGGYVVACLDVLQLTHGAVATVGSSGAGGVGDMASTMMQKFWDSALALEAPDDEQDTQSDVSGRHLPEAFSSEVGKMGYPSLGLGNSFAFKLKDHKGRIHRFTSGTESLTELISAIIQRVGDDIDRAQPPNIMYEDDDGDRVLLSNDSDLVAAINFARVSGLKGLKLYLENLHFVGRENDAHASLKTFKAQTWTSMHTAVAASALAVLGVALIFYLRRSGREMH